MGGIVMIGRLRVVNLRRHRKLPHSELRTMSAPNRTAAFDERLRRAHVALRAGQAASAEGGLRALAAERPGDVNCLWLLGAALLDQNKAAAALETLECALAAAPEFAEARVDLARA